MARCAVVSFRLGLSDGVSVVAEHWRAALADLGWATVTVAGSGPVDRRVPGLAIEAEQAPTRDELEAVLSDCDLVLVENLLSIPLNVPASRTVADVLRRRPAVLHHHDPPWQRDRFAHVTELPPDDEQWIHVTINRLTEAQFEQRGLTATTVYNGFDLHPPAGDRQRTRALLEIDDSTILAAHPVRAIARKNVPAALDLCRRIGATYWLPGPAEEGYGPTLERLLADTPVPVRRLPVDGRRMTMPDLYAACDLVVFPSLWEGFGNPPVEAAIHRRPAAVGRYPVAEELRALGFRWPDPSETEAVKAAVVSPPAGMLDDNRDVAARNLSLERMTADIARLLAERGWRP